MPTLERPNPVTCAVPGCRTDRGLQTLFASPATLARLGFAEKEPLVARVCTWHYLLAMSEAVARSGAKLTAVAAQPSPSRELPKERP